MTTSDRLRFESLDDVQRYLRTIDLDRVEHDGNWTPGQIFYHLAAVFEVTSEPPSPRASGRLRRFKKTVLRMLVLRGIIPRNVPIPDEVASKATPPDDVDASTELSRLLTAVTRYGECTTAPPEHPLVGPLTRAEWTRFHLRHCELHLRHLRTPDASS